MRNVIIILLLLGMISVNNCFASNKTQNWEDYKIYTKYDEEVEKLEIKYELFSEKNIGDKKMLEFRVGDKKCLSELLYEHLMLKGICFIDLEKNKGDGLCKS